MTDEERRILMKEVQQRIADDYLLGLGLHQAQRQVGELAGDMLFDGDTEGFKFMQGVFQCLCEK